MWYVVCVCVCVCVYVGGLCVCVCLAGRQAWAIADLIWCHPTDFMKTEFQGNLIGLRVCCVFMEVSCVLS